MDDLIIVLLEWLFKSLSGKGKASSGPMVRPGAPAVRPGAPMNRPAPPGLPSAPNRPAPPGAAMPMNRAAAANRGLPPNVRRVVIPANRRPVRRVAAPPPLPGRAAAPVQNAGVLPVLSAAKPAEPAKIPGPATRAASAGSWLSASIRPEALRRQIIINEILQPPIALREDSLFA